MGFFGKLFRKKNNIEKLVNEFMSSNKAPSEEINPLINIKDTRVVKLLIQALHDNNWGNRRRRAANALGEFGDKSAVEPLIQALKQSDVQIRRAAAGALAKVGNAEAVEALIQSLKDTDKSVRSLSANALGKIGDSRAVEHLIQALIDTEEDVRWYSVMALGEIGDQRALEPLTQALHDKSEIVRQFAQDALKKMKAMGKEMVEENNDYISFDNIKSFEKLLFTKYNILNETWHGIIEPNTYIDVLSKVDEHISIYLNVGKTVVHDSVFRIAVFPKGQSPQSSRDCTEFIGLGVFNQDPSAYFREQCVTADDIGLIKGRIMSRLVSTGRLTASAKDYEFVSINDLRKRIKQRQLELGLKED
jgi:hypothetical protein